jgi:hypothetical protein
MITKIILTLFALVLVSATLVFFVSRFEDIQRKHRPELAYTTETVPEKEENHCKEYVNIYESEKLKEYYTCYKEGDFGYKLNFLRHVLTITEYENTLAKNGSKFTKQQAYGLVQIMLNEISVSNFEMYEETYDLLKKLKVSFSLDLSEEIN